MRREPEEGSGLSFFTIRPLNRPPAFLVAISAVLILHQAFYFVALGGDAVDDAYISFRYARNWVEGEGLVFNPGERVEGYTNFLWTVVVAPAIALGLPVGPVAMVLGGICSLATLWLVYRYLEATSAGAWAGVLAAGFLAVDGSFALWAVGGLETALFALLVTAGAISYLQEDSRPRRGLATGLLFALATMTRPEGLLVLGATAVHSAARAAAGRRLPGQADLVRLLGFAAVYAPYFAWRFAYYGYLLPNTFYLKVDTSDRAAQIARGWNHLRTFVSIHLGLGVPFVAGLLSMVRARNPTSTAMRPSEHAFRRDGNLSLSTSYFLLVAVVYSAYIVWVGGDWSVGRFFVPVLPGLYLVVGQVLVGGYRRHRARFKPTAARLSRNGFTRFAAVVVLVSWILLFWGSSIKGENHLYVKPFDAASATHARVAMGRWLLEHVPQETFLAVDAAGQIPYFSQLRVLDMFGPTDIHIAHLIGKDQPGGLAGHTKFDFDYLLEKRPDVVVVCCDPEGGFLNPDVGYERAPWVWTDDSDMAGFLTLYRRTGWTPGMAILGADER